MQRMTAWDAPPGHDYPKLIHCRHCDSKEMMDIRGQYPALYCGKDAILYACRRSGEETVRRVAAHPLPKEHSDDST